ncbi:unnamed protein product, partial [Phaeothamnion confervicola]
MEAPALRLLAPLVRRALRSGLDAPLAAAAHITLGGVRDTYDLRDDLDMENSLTLYLYLVDPRGLVRWRASGAPAEGEVAALLRCTEELLLQEEEDGGTTVGDAAVAVEAGAAAGEAAAAVEAEAAAAEGP